jgi:hypothetical protein
LGRLDKYDTYSLEIAVYLQLRISYNHDSLDITCDLNMMKVCKTFTYLDALQYTRYVGINPMRRRITYQSASILVGVVGKVGRQIPVFHPRGYHANFIPKLH